MTTLLKLALALLVGSTAAVLLLRPDVERPRRLQGALDGGGSFDSAVVVGSAARPAAVASSRIVV